MGTEESSEVKVTESQLGARSSGPLLLQIRSDRRLGHEWDDWDGSDLPNGGVFHEKETIFFQLVAFTVLAGAAVALGILWLTGPRLSALWPPIPGGLARLIAGIAILALVWLLTIGIVLKSGRNWLPARLAERGLLPWVMPMVERVGVWLGMSKDRVGNATLRVFNGLTAARATDGIAPGELLILIPRCLGKEAMQTAMGVSRRYGVPLFVASRGRYARQMIAMRRPRGVIAVACERDLVSGVHDVAKHLPILGTTLQMGNGPCRDTDFDVRDLEGQVRRMLRIEAPLSPRSV